ncbi:class I-like SAM-binding methyltransferase super [Desmophyllum pertusum]|uniref:Class I-like SAM-binding methyltransferase super n=1 Tax=Desmophyllum pertusum TaxID=174260 RepID=A0A9X0CRI9_9CNID|nr:class I-like SAM-binding methyltransferase super [Desmophyllum pertusum]
MVAKAEFLARPLHNYELDPEDCLSQSAVLLDIDMSTFSRKNLEFISEKFEFVITKEGTFHGLCAWFSVTFGGVPAANLSEYVTLSRDLIKKELIGNKICFYWMNQ